MTYIYDKYVLYINISKYIYVYINTYILFVVMYKWTMEKGSFLVKRIEPPTLFVHFVYHSSLLRMCHWTEMYCRGAELRGLCQSLLFNL